MFSDLDRYLIGEGRHHQLYERLGAQLRTVDGTRVSILPSGPPTPAASRWSVISMAGMGDKHTARVMEHLGIWELFVPGAQGWRQVQVSHPQSAWRMGRQIGSDGLRCGIATADRLDRLGSRARINGGDQDWLERRKIGIPCTRR